MTGSSKSLLVFFLFFILAIQVITSFGQVRKYTFSFDSVSLSSALNQIETESDLTFFYKSEWIEDITLNQNFDQANLDDLLNELLTKKGINYITNGDRIILTGKVNVISSLVFDSSKTPYQVGYIFEREFSSTSDNVLEVGDRSKVINGSKAILAGYIKNLELGEPIPGAIVFSETAEVSTLTDSKGFFSMILPSGAHTLLIQFSGMKTKRQEIVLFSDGSLSLELEEEPRLLEEVTIVSDGNANVNNVRMGTASINLDEVKNVPKFMGENDMIQAALTLPGVQNVGEGSAGINVRGGKTDQNLILLNNATVYNPFHFFGFFTSFNADITANLELMKSGIPASYGGRLSSLLNVTMKKADKNNRSGRLAINPITTSASIELPLIKDRTAVMAGIRTTYSNWVTRNAKNEAIRNSDPHFSDFALNLNHSYGGVNSINLSAYYSLDEYKLSTDSTNSYSNANVAVEWKHLLSDKLSSTVIGGYSNYHFDIDYNSQPESAFEYGFKINELFGKVALNYFPDDKNEFTLGSESKLYLLSPGKIMPIGISEVEKGRVQNERGVEQAFFVSDELTVNPKITLQGGLRYSIFNLYGPGSVNFYTSGVPRNEGSLSGTQSYNKGEKIATYHGPELRFSAKYTLTSSSSVKIGITQMRQYIHSISSTVSVSPTDTWKLSDPNIKPQKSIQYSIGFYKTLFNNTIDASVETYYKTLDNLLDYKVGADLVLNESIETDVLQGEGRAYGLEVLLRKPNGKLNGWVSYAYGRSQQRFRSGFAENTINRGEFFPSNFEKPHSINIISNYKHTRRVRYSGNVVFSSGRPVTYATGK